jgi:predicted nucleotidyltransferase
MSFEVYKEMQTVNAQEIIQEMVRRIVEKFNPIQIILFGSYAQGTAGPDSDVDLLVVMPIDNSHKEKNVEVSLVLNAMGIAKDVFVVTPEEVQKYRDIVGSIIKTAVHEGKVLYERAA